MASHMTVVLVLTACREGQTCTLAGYDFVGGRCVLRGPAKAVLGAANYMGKSYAAFIEGSDDLARAQKRWAETSAPTGAVKEDLDGKRNLHPAAKPDPADPVRGDDRSDGGKSAPVSGGDGADDAGANAGGESGLPHGNRHPDSRVPPEPDAAKRELVAAALSALDHGDDTHWTQDGKPAVAVVTDVAGENISRQMIEVVAPDFVRVPPVKK